ncbi:MAG: GNAT family N-acetyltransferase [Gammaproteobacteria bacterium]
MQGRNGIRIGAIRDGEWHTFLRLAAAEGWRVTDRETELFGGAFADTAFVLRSNQGACGFVTTVNHERNGWIGNLLVASAWRGRGYGSALLDHAINSLRERGARCLWLTASTLGRPLYERRGFCMIDGIDRWAREGEAVDAPSGVTVGGAEPIIAADARAWGGSRRGLLKHLAVDGEVYSGGASVALLQAPGPMRVLGPWIKNTDDNGTEDDIAAVLSAAVAATSTGIEIVTDALRSAGLDTRLQQSGFRWQGYNALMAQGSTDHVDLARLISLASLGSMG